MEKRTLGRTGLQVTVLGFGGAEIGYEGAAPETVDKLLNAALDAGLNVIDTAECYFDSEELIGRAVAGRRGDFLLFTKCGHAQGFDAPDWDPGMLVRSIDRSLKRLRTDHVDLLQLHSCSLELLRRGDVIAVVQQARDAGKARFLGYSGDGPAAKYAVECGLFDTLQTSVSIADQEAIDLTLPLARERNVGVIAKRPIANAVWRQATRPANDYVVPYWERLRALDYKFLQGDPSAAVDPCPAVHAPGARRRHRHRRHQKPVALARERRPGGPGPALRVRLPHDPRALGGGGPARLGRPDLTLPPGATGRTAANRELNFPRRHSPERSCPGGGHTLPFFPIDPSTTRSPFP